MDVKRILAAGLALAMVTPGAVFAEEADNAENSAREYVTFDLQSLGANGIVFAAPDTKAEDAPNTLISIKAQMKYHDTKKYYSATQTPLVVKDGEVVKRTDEPAKNQFAYVNMADTILNKVAFDSFKAKDGYLYADCGDEKVPFDISTDEDKENVILLAGADNDVKTKVLDIEDGEYEEILFAGFANNTPDVDMYVEYTDGTTNKGKNESVKKLYCYCHDMPADQSAYAGWINQFTDKYDSKDLLHTAMRFKDLWKQTKTTTNSGTEVWTGCEYYDTVELRGYTYYIPVYSITVDPTKTVDKIVFSGGDAYRPIAILGVTGVKADEASEKNYYLNTLEEAASNSANADWGAVKNLIEKLKDASFTSDEQAIYDAAVESYKKATQNAEPIDISGSYTSGSVVWAAPGSAIDDLATTGKYSQNKSTLTTTVQRAFNKTLVAEMMQKQGGLLHTSDNIPYDIKTTGGVILGGTYGFAPQTIEINADKPYSKMAFLVHSTYGPRGTLGTVTYTDGVTEEYTTYVSNSTDHTGALFVYSDYTGSVTSTDMCVNADGTTEKGSLCSYILELDPERTVKSISVYGNDTYTCAVIFAMTGIPATDEAARARVMEKLSAACEALEDKSWDWAATNRYIKAFESYTDATEEETAIYTAVKAKYNEVTRNAKAIDISGAYGDSKIYAEPGKTVDGWEDASKFMQYHPTEKISRALNITVIKSAKAKQGGLIHVNKIPFDVDTRGGVILGGVDTNNREEKTIAVNAEEKYSELAFLVDNSHATTNGEGYGSFSLTVEYDDGSKDTQSVETNCQSTTADAVKATQLKLTDLHITSEDGQSTFSNQMCNSLLMNTVKVNSTKNIKNISMKYESQHACSVVLAVTAIPATEAEQTAYVAEQLNTLNTAESFDAATANYYIKALESLSGLTAEQTEVLTTAKEKYTKATNSSRTFDISSSFGDVAIYAEPGKTIDNWDTEINKYINVEYWHYLTDEAGEKLYETNDDGTNKTDAGGNQIQRKEARKRVSFAINQNAVEELKEQQGGVVHAVADDMTVPFDVTMPGGVILGGTGTGDSAPKTIALNTTKKYTKLALLADDSHSGSYDGLNVTAKVIYADDTDNGTTGENGSKTYPLVNMKNDIKATVSGADLHITNSTGATDKGGLRMYILEVDSSKKIQSIELTKEGSWTCVALLAVTGIGEQEATDLDKLTEYETLAGNSSLTGENVETAYQLLRKLYAEDKLDSDGMAGYPNILAAKKAANCGLEVTINDYAVDATGKAVTVNLDNVNEESELESAVAYAAVYDGTALVEVQSFPFEDGITMGGENQTAEFTFTTEITGKTVKCFVWDGNTPVSGVLIK